jgi:leucyl-tRNA synthetase
MSAYNPSIIEPKWQKYWDDHKTYATDYTSKKSKKYILDMFPYPSGEGLHVGHYKLYVASDILARYYRAKGYNVLHPMGWDAFGLPAENFAIKTGTHPSLVTQSRIANIKRQMKIGGLSYDWDREINTTDPAYYKWTQWIFIQLFKKGLAYEATIPINWCPNDKTGLANEEVINGQCERCGAKVERKEIRQWILRISNYADRLINDLDDLAWPEFIKEMQRNWIGRSEGARVSFSVISHESAIPVFTTRVDTLFGVTALVIAPEFKGLDSLVTQSHRVAVADYLAKAKNKSDLERTHLDKTKTGVFTGAFASHPLTGQQIPIWIADYVLGHYGTGAVMLVPAHDARDKLFANTYGLPVITVIDNDGKLENSGQYTGLTILQAQKEIISKIAQIGAGQAEVQFKLRDWVFSRQRYWGEPIPIVHCQSCGIVAIPEDQLPIMLPQVKKYEPTGTAESPLAAISEWVNTSCPECGGPAKRETNTMPQWAGSCWYYLRFCDPHNEKKLIDPEVDKYWLPVDWYLGGAEHAVLHLLYARFWHKFLYDIGVVSTSEPFFKLSSIGLVLAAGGKKMSKSKGNVISPDEIVSEYGADTLRLYEAFMGPFENTIAWDPNSINGVFRFLNRIWALMSDAKPPTDEKLINNLLKDLSKKVSADIEQIKLNTAIAAMMKFLNATESKGLSKEQKQDFLIVLAPFAPHIAEEAWQVLGNTESIMAQTWPSYAEETVEQTLQTIAIQVNGKVRGALTMAFVATEAEAVALAEQQEGVARHLVGHQIHKIIYLPGKILNLLVA